MTKSNHRANFVRPQRLHVCSASTPRLRAYPYNTEHKGCLCGMRLCRIFLHEGFIQNFLGVTSTYSALPAHAQAVLQISASGQHPDGQPRESRYRLTPLQTQTYISRFRSVNQLFGQDKLVVAGKPQVVVFTLMLNDYFLTL